MEPKVIVIIGPTCSGKTNLSLVLAERLNTEIISADSRQIYKYLTIGTAKPHDKDLKRIKHHLIDILNPDEQFNAFQFEKASLKIIDTMFIKNIVPIISGGSGLYIKALVDGISDNFLYTNTYEEQLKNNMVLYGRDYLYEELKKVDPVSASEMLPQNWKRVIRALEVFYLTGKPIWQHHSEYKRELGISFIQFGLNWNRDELYANINSRVDSMIESGLVEEVKNILALGYKPDLNSLNTVGYKEIFSYLNNEITFQKAVELIKRNTRHFAKRQLTWFRKDKRINWLPVSSQTDFTEIVNNIISYL